MSTSELPLRSAIPMLLIAEADSPSTKVQVINGRFDRVMRGLGRIEGRLPSGIYKVKFKTAHTIREQLVVLKPGSDTTTVRANPSDMRFPTAAPLHRTGNSREYHRQMAKDISRSTPLR